MKRGLVRAKIPSHAISTWTLCVFHAEQRQRIPAIQQGSLFAARRCAMTANTRCTKTERMAGLALTRNPCQKG